MELNFIGDVEQLDKEFLKDQYERHPELLKQEMINTNTIVTLKNRREDDNKHLGGLDAM